MTMDQYVNYLWIFVFSNNMTNQESKVMVAILELANRFSCSLYIFLLAYLLMEICYLCICFVNQNLVTLTRTTRVQMKSRNE